MRMMTRRILTLAVVTGLIATASADSNHAASFRWQGSAGTDLPFSTFLAGNHTITLRFFPQYMKAITGPLLTSTSGKYALGIRQYDKQVGLELVVGAKRATWSLGTASTSDTQPVPLENKWHTLAIVCTSETFAISSIALFLDGKHLADDAGTDLAITGSDASAISGNVQLGRSSDSTQYYGFLDDVAIFDKALTTAQIAGIFQDKRFGSSVENLHPLRVWTFDDKLPNGSALPASFAHSVTFAAPAQRLEVSERRDDAADKKRLPLPAQKSVMQLPFEPGQAWTVTQPFEGQESHFGISAFSYDFRLFDFDTNQPEKLGTCGTPVLAYAAGTLIDGCDVGSPSAANPGCATASEFQKTGTLIDGYDYLHLTDAPNETAIYEHILKGSLSATFPGHASEFKTPAHSSPLQVNIPVARGQKLAKAGTRGPDNCHLHFGVGITGTTTFPVAFTDYMLLDRTTNTWQFVALGIPQEGQIFRNPDPCACTDGSHPPNVTEGPKCTAACKSAPLIKLQCHCIDGTITDAGAEACLHVCLGHDTKKP
jgi:hypothetical protein